MGQSFTLPAYRNGEQSGEHTFTVDSHKGNEATVTSETGGTYTMPISSVKHFHDDLNRRVDVPEHPSHPGINAIRQGQAAFLGKGNDGIVFDTNDGNVAKVTTSVPHNLAYFRPHGHAISDARKQAELNNQAISEGHDLLLPQEFIEHGEKGFTIMPKLQIGGELSKEQIMAYREKLQAFHDAGWRLNDDVQHGVDAEGNIRIFDTGALEKIGPGADETSYAESQREHGDALLRQHGHFDDVEAEERLRTLLGKLRGPSSFVDAATQWQEMVDNGHDALPFLIDEAREALQPHQGNEMAAQFEELLASYESEEANRLLDERMVAAQQVFSDMVTDYEQYDEDDLPHGESLDSFIDDRDLFSRFVPDLNEKQLAALAFASYRSGSYLDDDTIHLAGFLIEPDELAYTAENGAVLRRVLEIQNDAGLNAKGDELRPGEETADGGKYEPEWITDQEADEFMRNQYPEGHTWRESGFLLHDGTLLDMSHGEGYRGDDHRAINPSEEAASRWGFEPDGQGDDGDPNSFSRWTRLQQLLNRARAIRIDGDAGLINAQQPPTNEQWKSIAEWIEDFEPDYAAVTLGETEWDVDNPTVGLLRRQFDAAAEGLRPGDEEWPGDEYDDESDYYAAADESNAPQIGESQAQKAFTSRTGAEQKIQEAPTPPKQQNVDAAVIEAAHLEPYEHVTPEPQKPSEDARKKLRSIWQEIYPGSEPEQPAKTAELLHGIKEQGDERFLQGKEQLDENARNVLEKHSYDDLKQLHEQAHPVGPTGWEDDEYLYHVTPSKNAQSIFAEGLKGNMPHTTYHMSLGLQDPSNVFLSEKSEVRKWLREIGTSTHEDIIKELERQSLELQQRPQIPNAQIEIEKTWSKITALRKLGEQMDRENDSDEENGFDYVGSGHLQIMRVPKKQVQGFAVTDEFSSDESEQAEKSFQFSNFVKEKTRQATDAIGKYQQTNSRALSQFKDLKRERIELKQTAQASQAKATKQKEGFQEAMANVMAQAFKDQAFKPQFEAEQTWRNGDIVNFSVFLIDPVRNFDGDIEMRRKLLSDSISIDLRHDRDGDKRATPLTLDGAADLAIEHFDFVYSTYSAPYSDQEAVKEIVQDAEREFDARSDIIEIRSLNHEIENYGYAYTEFANRTPTETHMDAFASYRRDAEMLNLAARYRQIDTIKGTKELADQIEMLVQATSEKYTANEQIENWKNQNQELYDHSLVQMSKSQLNEMKAKVASNPNFWEWAGNTKAVDQDGMPLIIFHGTGKGGFTAFDESKFDEKGHVYGSTDVTIASSYSGGYTDDITPVLANTVDDIRNSVANSPILEVIENDGLYSLHYKSDQGGTPYETDIINAATPESFVVQWNQYLYETPEGMRDGYQIQSRGVYPLVYKLENPLIVEGYGSPWHSVPLLSDEMQQMRASELAQVPQVLYFARNQARVVYGAAVDDLISYVSGANFDDPSTRNTLLEQLEGDYGYDLRGNWNKLAEAIDRVADLEGVASYDVFMNVVGLPAALSTRDYAKVAEKMGNDGIVFKNIVDYGGDLGEQDEEFDPGDVFVAFNPDQVKSAHNAGTFRRTKWAGPKTLMYQAAE